MQSKLGWPQFSVRVLAFQLSGRLLYQLAQNLYRYAGLSSRIIVLLLQSINQELREHDVVRALLVGEAFATPALQLPELPLRLASLLKVGMQTRFPNLVRSARNIRLLIASSLRGVLNRNLFFLPKVFAAVNH